MKVGVVGCGGIGSYFAQHIDRLVELEQITDMSFTFFDDDIVEMKNILYQNFDPGDVDSTKVGALEMRFFNIQFEQKRVALDDLKEFDMVILCADNNVIRKHAWDAKENWGVPFIDSRANGKTVGIFSSNTPNYPSTLSETTESQSCQNPFQIAKNEIEYGNVVIAAVLAQCVLSYSRTTRLPNDFIFNF